MVEVGFPSTGDYIVDLTVAQIFFHLILHSVLHSVMNGIKTGPSVADLAAMTTEERMAGMEHSEVRYFTR